MNKRILSMILCAVLVVAMFAPAALAAETEPAENKRVSVTYFPDGSYCVTELVEYDVDTSTRAIAQTKKGEKTARMFSSSNVQLFSITVYGTFMYNGYTVTVTGATYSYTVDDSLWSFSEGSTVYKDARATATGVFKYMGFVRSETLSVMIACSAGGVLS